MHNFIFKINRHEFLIKLIDFSIKNKKIINIVYTNNYLSHVLILCYKSNIFCDSYEDFFLKTNL